MSLLDLWKKTPDQLIDKQVNQVISFAGGGKLLDDSDCSKEFRSFLSNVPSNSLRNYSDQCLSNSFTDSGFALQDIINEVGSRLGSEVSSGRYRGTSKNLGFDGLWKFPSGHSIIVEVKTTNAYTIRLNTIANYRNQLIELKTISEYKSSMLLIVGREDTGDLEAQIRGSRHAWDIRVISVDSLFRLLSIKEEVEDPMIIQRIHDILIPREFTRLDEIVDVLFSTAEDIKQEEIIGTEEDEDVNKKSKKKHFTPVSFHDECILRVQKYLGITLLKQSKSQYTTPDKSIIITCSISKEHHPNTNPGYWFAFHPYQKESLKRVSKSYVSFGCGNSKRLLLIPFTDFDSWIDGMGTTQKGDRYYWHVIIYRKNEEYYLHRKKGKKIIDLTRYIVT